MLVTAQKTEVKKAASGCATKKGVAVPEIYAIVEAKPCVPKMCGINDPKRKPRKDIDCCVWWIVVVVVILENNRDLECAIIHEINSSDSVLCSERSSVNE